jgi:hypothetical protein
MKRIAYLLLGIICLLVACTSTTAAPPAPESALPAEDAQMNVEDSAIPETAVNELAAKPQFIMFTASW